MEIIPIDKRRLKNRLSFIGFLYLVLSFLAISFLNKLIMGSYHFPFKVFILYAVISAIYLIFLDMYVGSLTYEFEGDILIKSYQVILKNKDIARLQVVNDISITQNLLDKLFGFFTLTVGYGFGDTGYYFSFRYLSESVAEDLAKRIKPTGLQIIKTG